MVFHHLFQPPITLLKSDRSNTYLLTFCLDINHVSEIDRRFQAGCPSVFGENRMKAPMQQCDYDIYSRRTLLFLIHKLSIWRGAEPQTRIADSWVIFLAEESDQKKSKFLALITGQHRRSALSILLNKQEEAVSKEGSHTWWQPSSPSIS